MWDHINGLTEVKIDHCKATCVMFVSRVSHVICFCHCGQLCTAVVGVGMYLYVNITCVWLVGLKISLTLSWIKVTAVWSMEEDTHEMGRKSNGRKPHAGQLYSLVKDKLQAECADETGTSWPIHLTFVFSLIRFAFQHVMEQVNPWRGPGGLFRLTT